VASLLCALNRSPRRLSAVLRNFVLSDSRGSFARSATARFSSFVARIM
jgi:hypothetical protein